MRDGVRERNPIGPKASLGTDLSGKGAQKSPLSKINDILYFINDKLTDSLNTSLTLKPGEPSIESLTEYERRLTHDIREVKDKILEINGVILSNLDERHLLSRYKKFYKKDNIKLRTKKSYKYPYSRNLAS